MLQLNGYLHRERLSEIIGCSMHEERVLAQRSHQHHQGSVAKNIEWLMEYLFRFCLSPLRSIDEIPIRLWGRYMPDYIDLLYSRLAGSSAEADFTQACTCGEIDAMDPRSMLFERWASPTGQ